MNVGTREGTPNHPQPPSLRAVVDEEHSAEEFMTLWKIKDGIPSAADALLVVGGMLGACTVFVPCIEPILSVFEPLGWDFLGYFVALLATLFSGAAGFWLFVRNEKKLRWEVTFPRRVFAITSMPVILLVGFFTHEWAFRAGFGYLAHHALLVVCFVPIFGLVVRASLRFPHRAAAIAMWFQLSLAALGLLAKLAALVIKR